MDHFFSEIDKYEVDYAENTICVYLKSFLKKDVDCYMLLEMTEDFSKAKEINYFCNSKEKSSELKAVKEKYSDHYFEHVSELLKPILMDVYTTLLTNPKKSDKSIVDTNARTITPII